MSPRKYKRSSLERAFETYVKQVDPTLLEEAQIEHAFHPSRKWRFDYAWPEKVAVEIQGGRWMPHGGRHATSKDREKMNAAGELGWIVLTYDAKMIKSDPVGMIEQIKRTRSNRREGGAVSTHWQPPLFNTTTEKG